ncbi:hypothetical protein H7F33_05510 [Pedobacter sp. PAMC26386]|nr:hypothetical protein H7F33_05510 [Pedobacter sp. PAMC26386]
MNKEYLERAKVLFAKEETVRTLYFTSDGNMFRAEHYAMGWANGLADKKIETISRTLVMAADIFNEKAAGDSGLQVDGSTEGAAGNAGSPENSTGGTDGSDSTQTNSSETDEKAALVTRYIELYDTKPNHMTGVEKLKTQIATKEAELKAAEIAAENNKATS